MLHDVLIAFSTTHFPIKKSEGNYFSSVKKFCAKLFTEENFSLSLSPMNRRKFQQNAVFTYRFGPFQGLCKHTFWLNPRNFKTYFVNAKVSILDFVSSNPNCFACPSNTCHNYTVHVHNNRRMRAADLNKQMGK